jgi:hypothetical protein
VVIGDFVLFIVGHNIETATKSDYRREFCSAMHAICKKYKYDHLHDATSLQSILTELAGADGVRTLKDTHAPNAGTAHSVANSVSFLNTMMMNGDTNSEYSESAYGASSNSGSSEERRKSKKIKKLKARGKKKKEKDKDKDDKPKKNTCTYCRNTTARSLIASSRTNACGTRSICDELEVDFKPHHKFKADLRGYAEKEGSESE